MIKEKYINQKLEEALNFNDELIEELDNNSNLLAQLLEIEDKPTYRLSVLEMVRIVKLVLHFRDSVLCPLKEKYEQEWQELEDEANKDLMRTLFRQRV